eukprot:m.60338 g.60338  ORF g.60338 m.60338 type:complete len:570 (+) comp16082_c0_seq3:161-1870(+)
MKAPILLCMLLSVWGCWAAVSERKYEPTKRVEMYHTNEWSLSEQYARSLAARSVPFIILGVLFTLLYAFWSMCRCCCCSRQQTDSRNWVRFYTVLGVLLTATCVGILFYGFHADKQQSEFFEQIPELIDNVVQWKNETIQHVMVLLGIVFSLRQYLLDLQNLSNVELFVDVNEISNMINATEKIEQGVYDILAKVNETSLESLKEDIGNRIENIDDKRHQVVVAILALLLIFTVVRIALMLLDVYGPTACRPGGNKLCACFEGIWTWAFLLLYFFVWILAGFLLALSLFFADFCIAPTRNIVEAAGIENNEMASYYITCMDNTTQTNPVTRELDIVTVSLNDTTYLVNLVNSSLPSDCSDYSDCVAVVNITLRLEVTILSINAALGVDENGDGNYETGLFSLLSCTSVNGKVQAVLRVLCEDFFDALSTFFETFCAFAVLMTLIEFVKRRHPMKRKAEKEQPEMFTYPPTVNGEPVNGYYPPKQSGLGSAYQLTAHCTVEVPQTSSGYNPTPEEVHQFQPNQGNPNPYQSKEAEATGVYDGGYVDSSEFPDGELGPPPSGYEAPPRYSC